MENIQRILDESSRQLNEYEHKYGPVDRSEFDGEFIVPQEVRNRVAQSKGSLRIHGGLLTITRSRTFLSLSNSNRSSIHNSTPDLSRSGSVPNTPGSNHKLSLTSSYDSVLEENENEGMIIIKKDKNKKKKHGQPIQQVFANNDQLRRKSEDYLESRTSTNSNNVSMIAIQKQQNHVRQSSDQGFRLIPRVKKPTGMIDGLMNRSNVTSINIQETTTFKSSSSKSITSIDREVSVQHEYLNDPKYTQWGHVRGSNSFAADLNMASLSKYTIPRVTLTHHKEPTNFDISRPGTSRKSLPENRISTFIVRHDADDSNA